MRCIITVRYLVCLIILEGRKYFRNFLRTEFSEENVLFWLACEELKRETNAELVEEKARSIYEDYISILSPKEVSFPRVVSALVGPLFTVSLSWKPSCYVRAIRIIRLGENSRIVTNYNITWTNFKCCRTIS